MVRKAVYLFAPDAPAGIPKAIRGRDAVRLRSESWKLALAIVGACLQVTAGGLKRLNARHLLRYGLCGSVKQSGIPGLSWNMSSRQ